MTALFFGLSIVYGCAWKEGHFGTLRARRKAKPARFAAPLGIAAPSHPERLHREVAQAYRNRKPKRKSQPRS